MRDARWPVPALNRYDFSGSERFPVKWSERHFLPVQLLLYQQSVIGSLYFVSRDVSPQVNKCCKIFRCTFAICLIVCKNLATNYRSDHLMVANKG